MLEDGDLAPKLADKEGRAEGARLWLTEEFSGEGDDSERGVGGGSRTLCVAALSVTDRALQWQGLGKPSPGPVHSHNFDSGPGGY